MRGSARDRPRWLWVVTTAVLLYVFVPVAVVAVFSFNAQKSLSVMRGLSLHWYAEVFRDDQLVASILVSLRIALVTTVVATVLGTALAIGLARGQHRVAALTEQVVLLRLMSPEITGGVALLLLFTQLGIPLSTLTITLAHVTFSVAYVVVVVRTRLDHLPASLEEAALDLGATEWAAVRLVVLPFVRPAVTASAMLVFVLSFDNFITSYFTSGAGTPPLPVRIYSMIRFGVSPAINAIGVLLTVVSVLIALAAVLIYRRSVRTVPDPSATAQNTGSPS
ncbi:MAG: ABC transporter permease [Janthinobacterium lividum]